MWIHIDTYEYIIWIQMGAQEPGPGPELGQALVAPLCNAGALLLYIIYQERCSFI